MLEQEIHALLFASGATRSIDVSDILGLGSRNMRLSRLQCDMGSLRERSSEIVRPILTVLKRHLSVCHSVSLSGNPLADADVDELGMPHAFVIAVQVATNKLQQTS